VASGTAGAGFWGGGQVDWFADRSGNGAGEVELRDGGVYDEGLEMQVPPSSS